MSLRISGPEAGKLSAAVFDAFPQPPRLHSALQTKLDDSLFKVAGMFDEYRDIIGKVISDYNARHQIDLLVTGLMEDRPTNALLLKFAWDHGILKRPAGDAGKAVAGDGSLERMLDPVRGFTDPMEFIRRYGQIVKCVCRISVPSDGGVAYGTGFLIGDETVITNYHVVEPLIERHPGAVRGDVRLLFDYRAGPDGQTVTSGIDFKLVDDDSWLVDSSKYDASDLVTRSLAENLLLDRNVEHLDYAVLRVADCPGAKRLGQRPSENGELRGHLALPADAEQRFEEDFGVGTAAVFIFQHPSNEPLRLDWEKPAILGVNANCTRVLYNVNTQHGSSGSPCLNAKLDLIALHHVGGKDWPADARYLYNQGIPFSKIYDRLRRNGKLQEIG